MTAVKAAVGLAVKVVVESPRPGGIGGDPQQERGEENSPVPSMNSTNTKPDTKLPVPVYSGGEMN